MATACDTLEVDLSRVDLDVTWETQPCIDVDIEQTDITIEAVTVANQGPPGPVGPVGPKGDQGATGPPGPQGLPGAAATIAAGSTVTTAPGTPANVTNSGSSSAAVFDFAIPQGALGATGPTGPQGIQGNPGPTGSQGIQGNTGPTGPQGAKGDKGDIGIPAYTLSTADFTVPAVGSMVVVQVADTSWVALGEILYVQDAGGTGIAGALQVTAKTATSLTLLNPPVSSGAAVVVSSMNVFIEAPAAKTYVLDLDAPVAYTITKISLQLSAGTCTAALLRNGSAISGAASIAVSSTLATVSLSQAVSVDDNISLAITAPSSAANLSVAVRTTQ